jgi:hypothetical protein
VSITQALANVPGYGVINYVRLAWVDAMWIDDADKLWMPAAQLNRVPAINHGEGAVR